jgi:hypothetical protein
VKLLVALIASMLVALLPAYAEQPDSMTKVAVFDFELIDTSLQGEVDGPRKDEQERLSRAAEQLRLNGRIRPVPGDRHRARHSCGAQ